MNQTLRAVPLEAALQIHTGELSTEKNVITSDDASLFDNEVGFYTPSATFYYNDRVRVTLAVRSQYDSYYVLIKGLLEFHRPKDFLFTYNRQEKTIDVGASRHEVGKLSKFLANISVWLEHEIQFKFALREIIKFETVYREKRAEIYSHQQAAFASSSVRSAEPFENLI